MDQGPLVKEQVEAGLEVVKEYHRKFPIASAFWIKNVDGDWRLYLASEEISDANFEKGYREVGRITHEQRNPWLDPFQIRVVGADDPYAKAAMAVLERDPRRIGARYRPIKFGPHYVEEVYIYPRLKDPEQDDLDRKITLTVQ
jgi:hypothetical protein